MASLNWLWTDRVIRKRDGYEMPTPEEIGKALREIKENINKVAEEK
jgi:hypothetical protein